MKNHLADIIAATGALFVAFGLYLIYPPAACIFVGGALVWIGESIGKNEG